MITANNRAFDKNTHEEKEREKGAEARWLANNKGKACTYSERGREVTHVRSISLPLLLHKAFRKHWQRIMRLGNK